MNGAFVVYRPEPVSNAKPSPEIAAKLAQLRAEFLVISVARQRQAPHVFRLAAH